MRKSTQFLDVEDLLITYLSSIPGLGALSVEMPNQPVTPFVLISRVAGGDDYLTDHATVDVSVFHASRTVSSDFAELVDIEMHRLRRAGRGVDAVDVVRRPGWLNWGDENLQRHLSSYIIHSSRTLST